MRPEIYQGHNGYQAAVKRVVTCGFIFVPSFIYEGDIMFCSHFTDVEVGYVICPASTLPGRPSGSGLA